MGSTDKDAIYISATDLTPEAYYTALSQYNERFISHLKKDFSDLFGNIDADFCISCRGSDARLERVPSNFSPLELMIIHKDPFFSNEKFKEFIKTTIESYVGKISIKMDFKDLYNSKTMLSCYNQDHMLVFPTDILDSKAIYGIEDINRQSKIMLMDEYRSEKGKGLIDSFNKRLRRHKQIILSGEQVFKGNNIVHYDLENGLAYYDPAKFTLSFKAGPIRTIQFSIAEEFTKHIRKIKDEDITKFKEFVSEMPTALVDRFYAIQAEGLSNISTNQITDLSNSYMYFVNLYGRSQEEQSKKQNPVIPFDQKEVKERLISVDKILRQGILKK